MDKPNFSIIIPCPPGTIPKAVEHITNLNYPKDKIEIIVEEGYNPSAQRNRGIKKANGDIIGFTDDDCSMDANWLNNTIKHFNDPSVGVVGGPNLTPKDASFLSYSFGVAMSSYFGASSMSSRYEKKCVNGTVTEHNLIFNNMFVKNEIFKKGLFLNETIFPNEENEFLNRVSKNNYKLIYAPEVSVYHPRKNTLKGFAKQIFGYGSGRANQINVQPDSFKFLYLIPSIFVLGSLSLPLSIMLNLNSFAEIIFLCLMLYFIISLATSLNIAIKERKITLFPIMPALFLIIHISYGAGFIFKTIKLQNWYRLNKPVDARQV